MLPGTRHVIKVTQHEIMWVPVARRIDVRRARRPQRSTGSDEPSRELSYWRWCGNIATTEEFQAEHRHPQQECIDVNAFDDSESRRWLTRGEPCGKGD